MYEIWTSTFNNRRKRSKKIRKYHSKNGYIIVSASRGENSVEENNKNKNILKKELGRTGFSFKEVKGYYKEFGMKEPSLEKSFIVYAGNKEKSKELDCKQKIAKKLGI